MEKLISFILKNIQLIIIIVLVTIVVFLLLFKFDLSEKIGSSFGGGSGSGSVKETTGNSAKISQAYTYVGVHGFDENGGTKYNKAVMSYLTMVNITTNKEIKSFEIKNVRLTNSIKSEKSYITWPKHYGRGLDSNAYYEPMGSAQNLDKRKDEGRNFSYKIVDNPQFADEVSKTGGIAEFRYTLYGLGNEFNYENILNTTKLYSGGKEAIYAGLKQSDIESPIEFDVVITYLDKTKSVKHFKLSTNFKEVYEQGFSFTYTYQDQYVGTEF